MIDQPLRILFLGTPAFAVPALQGLLDHGERLVGVVTQPDRPKGRSRTPLAGPVKELALQAGLPVLQPTKIRTPEFQQQLTSLAPDLAVVVAYGRILPASLINLPRLGTINVHGSILPLYRGAAPIQWAIIRGETETGVTIMQMDEGLDTGAILHIEKLAIKEDDTAGSLADKMAALGAGALIRALDLLRAGRLQPRKQDDRQATLAPPLEKEAGQIEWRKSAAEIGCLIRGLDPWPGTATSFAGKRLRLFRPHPVPVAPQEEPGTIVRVDDEGLLIATGEGCLLVEEVQLEGGRRMKVADFRRGHPVTATTRLG